MLSPRVHNAVSYGGACVVYALCVCLFGGVDFAHPTAPATVGFTLWTLHFLRRTAETLFLFEFGAASVKWDDSVTEFLYYWLFGFFVWWQLSGATQGAAWTAIPAAVVAVAVGAWAVSEYANFRCHHSLRNLKRSTQQQVGGSARTFPPAGLAFLFGHVACPHYTFEILSWVFFNLATGFTVSGTLFNLAGAIIMTSYAVERHDSYVRQWPTTYPKHRTPIIPFLDVRPPAAVVQALARS